MYARWLGGGIGAQIRGREEVCEEDSGAVGGRRAVRAPSTKDSVSDLSFPLAGNKCKSLQARYLLFEGASRLTSL